MREAEYDAPLGSWRSVTKEEYDEAMRLNSGTTILSALVCAQCGVRAILVPGNGPSDAIEHRPGCTAVEPNSEGAEK
jgi:hypothetical protein